jgi:hypothetical protein
MSVMRIEVFPTAESPMAITRQRREDFPALDID